MKGVGDGCRGLIIENIEFNFSYLCEFTPVLILLLYLLLSLCVGVAHQVVEYVRLTWVTTKVPSGRV